jgi:general secretion pathway protein D
VAVEPAATETVPPEPAEAPPIVLPLPPKRPAQLALAGPDSTAVGQEFTVAVEVSGIDKLYSAPLFVNYDPTLIEFVDAQEGPFLGQSGQTTVFSYSPNSAAGQVVVGNKQGTGGPGAAGNGTLFTLRFRGKAAGSAKVELNRVNFRDPAGKRLAVEPAAAAIVIR